MCFLKDSFILETLGSQQDYRGCRLCSCPIHANPLPSSWPSTVHLLVPVSKPMLLHPCHTVSVVPKDSFLALNILVLGMTDIDWQTWVVIVLCGVVSLPFSHCRTSWLCSSLGNQGQCCCKYLLARLCVEISFQPYFDTFHQIRLLCHMVKYI